NLLQDLEATRRGVAQVCEAAGGLTGAVGELDQTIISTIESASSDYRRQAREDAEHAHDDAVRAIASIAQLQSGTAAMDQRISQIADGITSSTAATESLLAG